MAVALRLFLCPYVMIIANREFFSINHINTQSYEKENLNFTIVIGLPQRTSPKNFS